MCQSSRDSLLFYKPLCIWKMLFQFSRYVNTSWYWIHITTIEKLCHTLSINHHTSLGYTREVHFRSNTYCSSTLGEFYSTKMDAWRSCDLMQQKHNNCTAINDQDCDDDKYKICKEGSTIPKSSKGTCTYSKQGNINSKYFLTILRL